MSINYFPYDRRLTPRAQELRHDMTPQERSSGLNFCAATLSNFTNSASLNIISLIFIVPAQN